MYSKIKKAILKVLRIFLIIVLWGMCIDVFLGVIFRFIIKKPLVWAEEYALISMVWMTFIGASVGYEANSHLGVDLLLLVLPNTPKKIVEILTEIMVMPFFIALIVGGAIMVNTTKGSITPALNISVAFQYAPALVGGVLLLWFNIEKLIIKVKNFKNDEIVNVNN